jgi:hypothetical protein
VVCEEHMTYEILTLKAQQQTLGDLAIMRQFPGVFTSGTCQAALPIDPTEQELPAEITDEEDFTGRTDGESY